jgi:hypothetical protein
MPAMNASLSAASIAASAASNAMARESIWREPVSTSRRPATQASINAQAGVLSGSPLPKNGQQKRTSPTSETAPTGIALFMPLPPVELAARPCRR